MVARFGGRRNVKDNLRTTGSARPLAGYVGGKRQLAGRVIAAIERQPHDLYCEAFVGMGGVFFRRRAAPKAEAINDLSRDVATFFRVLQRHYQAFMDMLKWQVASRAEFERLVAQDPERLTDLERAARFLYLQRLAFGGKIVGRTFGVDPNGPARFDITKLGSMLEAAHERLAGVWIECLPWRDFIARWDRPGALFYLDPPYWGVEHCYGRGMFARSDFAALNEALKGLQGAFVLTLNDVPEVRSLFRWARIEEASISYTLPGMAARKAAREVIITPK